MYGLLEFNNFKCYKRTEFSKLKSTKTTVKGKEIKIDLVDYANPILYVNILNFFSGKTDDFGFLGQNLRHVIVPNGTETLKSVAFGQCKDLTEIILPYGLRTINAYAFINCESLFEIEIPDTVTYIGNNAFYDCYKLNIIKLPNSLEVLEKTVFKECEALKNIIYQNRIYTNRNDLITALKANGVVFDECIFDSISF